jgi:hypothetical protein
MQDNDFESEEITRTIPGLANAIATGDATALVFEDSRDAEAHTAWSTAATARRSVR